MAYQPFQTFQVLAPIPMPITASSYTEAVKNYVKMHRSQSIDQLIIADQLNNNRMLANIKYYNANNRNKFSANLVPTTLTTLNGGMYPYGPMIGGPLMPMGRGPTNRPFVGGPPTVGPFVDSIVGPTSGQIVGPIVGSTGIPIRGVHMGGIPMGVPMGGVPMGVPIGGVPMGGVPIGGPMVGSMINGPFGNPLMLARSSVPYGAPTSTGSVLVPGSIITGRTVLGTSVELPTGTVLPLGSVIDATDNFPQGFCLPFNSFIDRGIQWNYVAGDPWACTQWDANGNVLQPINPTGGTSGTGPLTINRIIFPVGCNIPAGACFPPGTFISQNTILINNTATRVPPLAQTNTDVCLPKGTVIPRGTVFDATSFLPLGSIIAKGTNIPATTNLPDTVSLPLGTFIDLTQSPTPVNITQTNIIPALTPFVRFNLTGAYNIPVGSNFPPRFVFPPPSQSNMVFVPAPAMAMVAPMSSLSPPRHHSRHPRY